MIHWLLVGALREEVHPIVAALKDRRHHDRRTVLGTLGGQSVAVVRCGVGPVKALSMTRRSVQTLSPARVLSFGTCGSLDPSLSVGTVVTAGRLCRDHGRWWTVEAAQGWPAVGIATVDAPVWDAAGAQPLLKHGARVCEMEAAAVLEASGNTPMQALKVVSDLVGVSPPPRILPGGAPHPRDMLRFRRLAARLSGEFLLPAMTQLLYSTSKD